MDESLEQLIALRVNGVRHEVVVPPRRTLSDVLRHDLGLTGTHVGCEHGICGACTVIVDGAAVRSCLLLAVQVEDCEIETVEGLAGPDGEPNALQRAFHENRAQQCGFCTPGFLMLAEAAIRERGSMTEEEVTDLLASNVCRCTGYDAILAAVNQVMKERR
ncbi:MAG: (2Fe-2S)-binding protein [Actinobacteria bacterium]|nr:(2Fe-2S)-binding protein [Actinomycetota bacterium]